MARPGDDERRGGGRQPRDSLPTGRWSGPSLAITSSALSRHYGPQRSAGSNAGCAGRSATRPPEPPLIARTRPSTTLSPDVTGRAVFQNCLIARRQYVPERPRCGDENTTFGIATSSSAGSSSAPRDARDAQGSTRHGFRERTVSSRVIARQLYGIIYDRNESDQKLLHP